MVKTPYTFRLVIKYPKLSGTWSAYGRVGIPLFRPVVIFLIPVKTPWMLWTLLLAIINHSCTYRRVLVVWDGGSARQHGVARPADRTALDQAVHRPVLRRPRTCDAGGAELWGCSCHTPDGEPLGHTWWVALLSSAEVDMFRGVWNTPPPSVVWGPPPEIRAGGGLYI